MQRGTLGWLVAGGVVATGCVYLEPLNRPPTLGIIRRVCDDAHRAAPCALENLHDNDLVLLVADFDDPDGDPNNAVVHWRIAACPDLNSSKSCSEQWLYNDSTPTASFQLRPTVNLDQTGGPTNMIDIELRVSDDRGAPSFGEQKLRVIHDRAAAPAQPSPSFSP